MKYNITLKIKSINAINDLGEDGIMRKVGILRRSVLRVANSVMTKDLCSLARRTSVNDRNRPAGQCVSVWVFFANFVRLPLRTLR